MSNKSIGERLRRAVDSSGTHAAERRNKELAAALERAADAESALDVLRADRDRLIAELNRAKALVERLEKRIGELEGDA